MSLIQSESISPPGNQVQIHSIHQNIIQSIYAINSQSTLLSCWVSQGSEGALLQSCIYKDQNAFELKSQALFLSDSKPHLNKKKKKKEWDRSKIACNLASPLYTVFLECRSFLFLSDYYIELPRWQHNLHNTLQDSVKCIFSHHLRLAFVHFEFSWGSPSTEDSQLHRVRGGR